MLLPLLTEREERLLNDRPLSDERLLSIEERLLSIEERLLSDGRLTLRFVLLSLPRLRYPPNDDDRTGAFLSMLL